MVHVKWRVWVKREIAKIRNAKTAMGKMRKYVGEYKVRKLGKLRKCENATISVYDFSVKPKNITLIQAYAPTSPYDDDFAEEFYEQLESTIKEIPRKDLLIKQGD